MKATQLTTLVALLGSLVDAKWKPPKEYALKISPNGRYFQEHDGKPFFWQADTAWLLTHRLTMPEIEKYLKDRAAKGFNVVNNVGFTQIGIDSPNRNGDLTFHDEDVTKPNEPYWAFVDKVVKLAWEKYHIRMALIPAWGQYAHGNVDAGVFNTSNGEAFGRFIGARYPYLPKLLFADTNPFWGDQGALVDDYTAGGIQGHYPSADWRPVWDVVARGIVGGEREAIGYHDSYEPLLTMHPRNQWFPDRPPAIASAQLGDRDYLTFDAAQSGHVYLAPHPPTPWWNAKRGYETVEVMYNTSTHGRRRPVIDNEPHYEERFATQDAVTWWNASDVRTGSWQTALCGAAGVTYGDDNVMQIYIPGVNDPANSGNVRAWDESLNAPGAGQMKHLTKALLDRGKSILNRIPAQNIVVGDAGLDDKRVTAMRDSENSWIMVYTPTDEPFSINISSLRGRKVKASWLNPVNGKYRHLDISKATGPAKAKTFTPPSAEGHSDWTLILEASK